MRVLEVFQRSSRNRADRARGVDTADTCSSVDTADLSRGLTLQTPTTASWAVNVGPMEIRVESKDN